MCMPCCPSLMGPSGDTRGTFPIHPAAPSWRGHLTRPSGNKSTSPINSQTWSARQRLRSRPTSDFLVSDPFPRLYTRRVAAASVRTAGRRPRSVSLSAGDAGDGRRGCRGRGRAAEYTGRASAEVRQDPADAATAAGRRRGAGPG